MCVTMVTHHVGDRTPAFLSLSMVQAPWPKRPGYNHQRAPLCRRCIRLHPQIGQAHRRFALEVVHGNGPALLRDRPDWLC